MENRLDQLFRNQLSKHVEEPSPRSWDQVQEMLTSKRRAMWTRRLAIAASVTVFAVATFFAYRSVNLLPTGTSIEVVDAESVMSNDTDISSDDAIIGNDDALNSAGQDSREQSLIVIESHDAAPASIEKSLSHPIDKVENSFTATEISDESPATKEAENEDNFVTADDRKTDEQAALALLPLELEEEVEHPEVEENAVVSEPKQVAEVQPQEKTYPRVQIVFKADRESELVASNNTTIFTKGINKITEFSEEHLLTADRKTKLRNTKDDLLALNFGKLLNKSNKELEN